MTVKEISYANLEYTCEGTRFYVNGGNFTAKCNVGEMIELVICYDETNTIKKTDNIAYDVASDCGNKSIKSAKASLTDKIRANDYETIYNRYFETVHSTEWVYGILNRETETVTAYYMNKTEFQRFLKVATAYEPSTKRIRFRTNNKNVITELQIMARV